MQAFEALYRVAAGRKGGSATFEDTLTNPKNTAELAAIPDDRWLSMMSKCVFQSGFNWKVVNNKWSDFEDVFHGFDIGRMGFLTDEEIDELTGNTRIIRHGKKIASIRDNAQFLAALARENGTAARAFAEWPRQDFVGLLDMLKKRASRLGGTTGMYFLRFMGVDGFLLSRDVVTALIREGVVDKTPNSNRDRKRVQAAFNTWCEQSGRPMTHVSRVLACTVGE